MGSTELEIKKLGWNGERTRWGVERTQGGPVGPTEVTCGTSASETDGGELL